MKKKAADILDHIWHYCKDVQETLERIGKDKAVFESDKDFRNSICMSLLQIGELTGHLPEDFREQRKVQFIGRPLRGCAISLHTITELSTLTLCGKLLSMTYPCS